MLHMLDTEIASYIIKARPPAIDPKLAAIHPSMICVSAITRAELLYGLKRLPTRHRLHVAVRAFLQNAPALSWDADATEYYADVRHALVTAGQPIGEMDMMIAAHALSASALLVTNNTRHFARIGAPLMTVNWTAV